MKRPVRVGLFFAVVAWLAGCPVGCPKGNPQTIYEGPPKEVELEETGRCTYRATPPLEHPFPHDPGGTKTGAYFVSWTMTSPPPPGTSPTIQPRESSPSWSPGAPMGSVASRSPGTLF